MILDYLCALCSLIISAGAFCVFVWSSPRAKISMPMPRYIRLAYVAVGSVGVWLAAHKTWLANHPSERFGHTNAEILVWWSVLAAFFGLTAFSVWRRRLAPEVWEVLQKIGLASRSDK